MKKITAKNSKIDKAKQIKAEQMIDEEDEDEDEDSEDTQEIDNTKTNSVQTDTKTLKSTDSSDRLKELQITREQKEIEKCEAETAYFKNLNNTHTIKMQQHQPVPAIKKANEHEENELDTAINAFAYTVHTYTKNFKFDKEIKNKGFDIVYDLLNRLIKDFPEYHTFFEFMKREIARQHFWLYLYFPVSQIVLYLGLQGFKVLYVFIQGLF